MITTTHLAYTVLIKANDIPEGSGFLYYSGDSILLITARHVIFDTVTEQKKHEKLELVCPNQDYHGQPSVILLDLARIESKYIQEDEPSDLCSVLIGYIKKLETKPDIIQQSTIGFPSHVTTRDDKVPHINCVHPELVKGIKDISIADTVYVNGFPSTLGLPGYTQFDNNKALLRKGIVAGIHTDQGTIILDCMTFPGNSGSPVIKMKINEAARQFEYTVVGLVKEFIPYKYPNINSGYTVATSLDLLPRILK
jgi:hypothetical protein